VSASRSSPDRCAGAGHSVTLRLDELAWEAIHEEAARGELAVEELITFSVLYYLADVDSGRISRKIARGPYPLRGTDRPRDRAARGLAALSGGALTDQG
jgi:hypothetical protein